MQRLRPKISASRPPRWCASAPNEGSPGAGGVEDGHGGGMTMQFTRVVSPVEDMEIWNASGDGFSFVISHESRSGPGFHGPPGYVASWLALSKYGRHPGRRLAL
jgi:hypothetical protein